MTTEKYNVHCTYIDDLDEINIPLTWSPCYIPRHEQEELVRTLINTLCGYQTSDVKCNKTFCITT